MNFFTKIKTGAIALAALVFATPSFATVIYHYSGHNGPNSEGTSAYVYVPLYAPITFDFTVAAPLAAGLSNVNILSSVLSWTASGGTALATITSADPNPYAALIGYMDRIRISTDSAGDITTFYIYVAAKLALQPTTEAVFGFEHDAGSGFHYQETFSGTSLVYGGGPFVAAGCFGTGACGGTTTFAALADTSGGPTTVPPTTVPEPSTLALLVIGVALALGTRQITRRRSGAFA